MTTAALRTLAFATMFNFRDIGGYEGLDGRTVRWQRIYRADSPHRLSGDDEPMFAALGVRTVIDLRRPHEIDAFGRIRPADGLDYRHVHLVHQDWDEIPYQPEQGPARYLADRYHDLTEQAADGIVTAMSLLAEAQTAPAVVHCMAGKDRTGLICAMTLSLLGVPDPVIAEDYELSTTGSAQLLAWLRTQRGNEHLVPEPFFCCPAEAMQMFLTELSQRHGSVEGYLRGAGLPADRIEALRAHLLTD
ncbi:MULTISPECIES: tyrosine-protein phosphatase [unclassified Solwaraspora]|uniref:tyrosine-protein phosphatase n=1 Tax=unclassified Solwaraspora TaxID=2627926 RepID=UPI00259B8A17|nr:tyrosine-protein phosphatase [Solwaraspora sp. WMMA2056]WJK40082.1 tyrosine-protein phosphatase [Solwaraspora sp. WMMA2056]